MVARRSFIVALLLSSAVAVTASFSRISVKDNFMVDEEGRVRIFRGFNDVSNSPGQGESQGAFDGSNYMPRIIMSNDTRLDELINTYGFNTYRISAAWAALQPNPPSADGSFTHDYDYMDALSNVVQHLANHGAFSLLDMHQDGLSTRYASYDGIPRWLANLTESRHDFPWPWKSEDSAPHDIPEAPAQNFGEIYHDKNGGRTAWAAAWQAFAERFNGNNHVLGYELMNEPWAGDVYHDPTLFLPGVAGKKSLSPAYDQVAKAIRSVDNETTLFFEPIVWGMVHDSEKTIQKLISSGFEHVPGGDDYADRSVFSFHYYCWFAKNGDGVEYPSWEKKACDNFLGPAVFDAVDKTSKRLGSGSMMTEFGGAFFSPEASNPTGRANKELVWILGEADARLQSWTFWDLAHFYDYPEPAPGCRGNDPNCDSLKIMSRPYAQATAGTPTLMRFDVNSSTFNLAFEADTGIEAPTEIFLPPHIYTEGYDVHIESQLRRAVSWEVCDERPNTICVSTGGERDRGDGLDAGTVTILVSPPLKGTTA